jgi:hypothetical protein
MASVIGKLPADAPPLRKTSTSRLPSILWLIALAGILSLQIWFPHIETQINDTYSVDVGGRNAFFQFAERRLPDVERNHEPLSVRLDRLDPDTTLCLLGPARYPSPREWQAIVPWVQSGGRLLLACQWGHAEVAIPGVNAEVRPTEKPEAELLPGLKVKTKPETKDAKDSAGQSDETSTPAGTQKKSTPKLPALPTGANWTSLMTGSNFTWKTAGIIEAPGAEVLVKTGDTAQAVHLRHGLGTIVLIATDQIFSNAALYEKDRPNGVLAVKLLESAGPTDAILFDESLNESGTPKVVGVLLDPVLRPATIQLAVLIVTFAWRGNRRFGGLLPTTAPARHDVADHTNSLGNLYYKAHHGNGVLREYIDQLKTELRLRYAAGHEQRVLAPIAREIGSTVDEVQRILADADAAARKPKLTRREAAGQIRKLARLRQAARADHRQPRSVAGSLPASGLP